MNLSKPGADDDAAVPSTSSRRPSPSTGPACARSTRPACDYLVGGAYAFARYTGIERHTKDFDIFCRAARRRTPILAVLDGLGCRTEMTFPHWLAKAYNPGTADFIDVIYSSGNGIAVVDDEWFAHSVPETVLGIPVAALPGGGDDLVEGLHHGARALRRHRRRAPAARLRRRSSTGTACCAASATTGACCSATWCCSGSSIRRSGRRSRPTVLDELMRRLQRGDDGRAARRQDLPGHADLAGPVPGRHRAVGLPRRAARARASR